MNSLEYFNQRSDEVERILSAGRGKIPSLYDPQKPTPYQIQQQNADDVRKMLEIMQKNQEEQARETKKAQSFSRWSLVVGVLTLAATIIFGILQVTH
nr:MAG TPA: hypothetical protein [Caudoviricetes sp.]